MLIRIYLFVLAHCFSYFCCLTANDLREEGFTMVYGSEGLIPSSWGGMGQQAQEADWSHHIHGQEGEVVELTYL